MTLALELTTLGLEPNFGLRCTMQPSHDLVKPPTR